MSRKFLDDAYGHDRGKPAVDFYDEWASSYDEELTANGYVTPARCAAALAARVADKTRPVLDLGCGTGMSGAALRKEGFSAIDGWDPSPEMLGLAERRRIYRMLRPIDPTAALRAPMGLYAAVNAAGVMSPGLAPPEAFDQILGFLSPGGLICFSLNDHALADGTHLARIDALARDGIAEIVFREYGDHIPGKGMRSEVFVLERR